MDNRNKAPAGSDTPVEVEFPEFFDLVGNVRAMRRLSARPVPRALLFKVLNAGVQAPSGQNTQPWRFVVVEEPERKRWFAERYAHAMESRFGIAREQIVEGTDKLSRQLRAVLYQMDHLHDAPYLLLVCGLRDWPFKVPPEERVGLAPPNFGAVYPLCAEYSAGLPCGWARCRAQPRCIRCSRMSCTRTSAFPTTTALW